MFFSFAITACYRFIKNATWVGFEHWIKVDVVYLSVLRPQLITVTSGHYENTPIQIH